jgi:hypothetical protein
VPVSGDVASAGQDDWECEAGQCVGSEDDKGQHRRDLAGAAARLTMTAMPSAAASRPAPGSGPAAGEVDPDVVTAISTLVADVVLTFAVAGLSRLTARMPP